MLLWPFERRTKNQGEKRPRSWSYRCHCPVNGPSHWYCRCVCVCLQASHIQIGLIPHRGKFYLVTLVTKLKQFSVASHPGLECTPLYGQYNNYSMSPSWIWSDKITNERELVIITSYPTRANGIIVLVNSQTGFCRRSLFPQFYKASGLLNLPHYFPYDVKLRLLAHSRSFLANQKARNAIVGAENLLNRYVGPQRVWFFSHFVLKYSIDFGHEKG